MLGTRSQTKKQEGETSDTVAKAQKSSTPKKKTATPPSAMRRSRRNQTQEELQSKNTGVGLSIDINGSSKKKNKKIVFDEDEVITDEPHLERHVQGESSELSIDGPTEHDDVDDEVEEVKGSSAREEILNQLEAEEKGALKAKKKKKRKERRTVKDSDDEGEDFDDDFFAQLETVKADEEEKKKLESKKKKGKHTTFVVEENDQASAILAHPKKVGHNIQVVVLPEPEEMTMDDGIFGLPTSELSTAALLYSRSILKDGTDMGAKRKRGSPSLPDTSWKRSRKMNLIMTTKSRFNRRGGRGRPAANFVSKAVK
jgi:hypothetical protein